MLKNNIYFLLDRLNITKAERVAMVTITTMIMLITTGAAILEPENPFPAEHYARADSIFRALSDQKEADHANLMSRYEPSPVGNTETVAALQSGTQTAPKTQAGKASKSGSAKVPALESIILNTAVASDLVRLPGIGPKTAEVIVDYRKEHGPFQDLSHVMRVKGIGPKKWEQIRPYLRLNE
jgi:competence ComEA-like helix-hairpin-helix protein